MPNASVSIVVPAYNEERTIGEVLRRVSGLGLATEIIVVDDGSVDGTVQLVRSLEGKLNGLVVLPQDANRGKGAAVRAGIQVSTGDIVVIQDADLEYDPADIPTLLRPLQEGVADVVYGTRLRGGEPQRAHLFWHYLGNRALSLMTNVLYNTTLSDMETCYKLFDRTLIDGLTLRAERFEFEPEVTAKILRQGVRIYEVPISYTGREFDEGKKITWRDGFVALWTLVKYRFVE